VSLQLILDSAVVEFIGQSSLGFGSLHNRSAGVTNTYKRNLSSRN